MSSAHHIPFLRPKLGRAPPTSDSVASESSIASSSVTAPASSTSRAFWSVEKTTGSSSATDRRPCVTLIYDEDDCEVVQGLEVVPQFAPSCPYERFYDIVLDIHNLHRTSPVTISLSLLLHAHMTATLPLLGLQHLTARISQAPEQGLWLLELYLAPSVLRSCHIGIDVLARVTEALVGMVGATRALSHVAKCGWVSIARVVANAETTLRGSRRTEFPETVMGTIHHAGGRHPSVWGSSVAIAFGATMLST